MFIEFSVGNFRSFKEIVTFSMVAANLQSQDKAVDENNTFVVNDKLRLLKSAAIYGANASGKTNLGKAMQFMRSFVLNSSKNTQADEPIPVDVFRLSETTLHEPSFFQIVFIQDGVQYRYGFEVTSERIVSEWLFSFTSKKESNLFQRDKDGIRVGTKFSEGKILVNRTRDNALFLSVAAQFNVRVAQRLLVWFRSFTIVLGKDEFGLRNITMKMLEHNSYADEVGKLIKQLDLDIVDVHSTYKPLELSELLSDFSGVSEIDISPDSMEKLVVQTIHHRYDGKGNISGTIQFDPGEDESEGTQKLITLAGPLVQTLRTGIPLFMDELDARLHPLITCAIIGLFNSPDKNPHNAQLIFATHDVNLLRRDLFRRDQIWFAEKDRQGATHLYSLAEFRGVRNDSSFESDYIQGRFGAIPFLGDFGRVFGAAEAQDGEAK